MKDYYVASPELIQSNKLSYSDFRIYNYLCWHYTVTNHKPYIKITDIAGTFFYTTTDVIKILDKFTQIEINNKKLLEIYKNEKGIEFEMPYYKHFLIDLGFKLNNYQTGFKNIKNKISNIKTDLKKYLFPTLDQFDLSDALRDMPDEDFEKIKPDQLRFPWVYYDEKTRRTNTQ